MAFKPKVTNRQVLVMPTERQLHTSTSWGHEVQKAACLSKDNSPLVPVSQHVVPVQTHSRQFQCKGELVESSLTSHRVAVVAPSTSSANCLETMGETHIDLFATWDNFNILTFVSPFPDPIAWAPGALVVPWSGMWANAFHSGLQRSD